MPGTDTYLCLRAFVDELARCGVREAVTSPGSRSTPLVLSLARDPALRATSHIDERSAAFFALGVAKASGVPAVLACTSGTAAANYLPAVIEAHEARVPMLVLTADRPVELRDIGAGQTIDQIKLYGGAAKWFVEVDDHPASPMRVRWLRQLACRAFWTAVDGRPGPVHLNFAFREPLVPDGPSGVPSLEVASGRDGGRPWVTRPASSARRVAGVARRALRADRRAAAGGDRRGAGRTRSASRRLAGRVRRAGRVPVAGRSAVGRAARAGGDRALRRVAALSGGRHLRLTSCCGSAIFRPPSRCARGWRHRMRCRSCSTPRPRGRTRRGASARSSAPIRGRRSTRCSERLPRKRKDTSWLDGWHAADRAAAGAIASAWGPSLSEPRVAAEVGSVLPQRRGAGRRVLDADPRRRDVLPGATGGVPRLVEPRRERDRRNGLHRVRRGRGRPAGRSCC